MSTTKCPKCNATLNMDDPYCERCQVSLCAAYKPWVSGCNSDQPCDLAARCPWVEVAKPAEGDIVSTYWTPGRTARHERAKLEHSASCGNLCAADALARAGGGERWEDLRRAELEVTK